MLLLLECIRLSIFEKLVSQAGDTDFICLGFVWNFHGDFVHSRDALAIKPVSCFLEGMVWNEVLHEYVLLSTVTDWTDTSAATRQFVARSQITLQALETGRAEAARGQGGALNQILTELTLKRWR